MLFPTTLAQNSSYFIKPPRHSFTCLRKSPSRRMNDSFSSTRARVPSEGLNEILHPSPNSSSAADRKDNEPNQKDPLCERGSSLIFFGWAFSTISKLPTQLMGRNLAYFYIVNDPFPECLLTFLLVFQLSSLRGN